MMSRIFTSPLDRVRLAEVSDAPVVLDMVSESMAKTFRIAGTSEIINLIENSVLAVCQLNMEQKVIGFLAVKDHPSTPSVHPRSWEDYIWTKYKTIELKCRNTLFIHLLCWNSMYSRDVVDSMLKSVFMHDPYIQHIGMMKSVIGFPQLLAGQARSEASFRRVQALERGVPGDQLPVLLIADRKEVSPRLRIRRAVEEDNDDILPIIERHSVRLREMYGDYYISELVSRHPESERVLLVCEHNELAVGVMCLNTVINFESLEECFELSPYAGLRHVDTFMQLGKKFHTQGPDSAISLGTDSYRPESSSAMDFMEKSDKPKALKSRVTWLFEDDEFKDIRKPSDDESNLEENMSRISDEGKYSRMLVLELLDEDEEEFEFDIVNIDPVLLRLQSLISYVCLSSRPSDNLFKNILDGRQKERESAIDDKTTKKEKKWSLATPLVSHSRKDQFVRYTGSSNAFLLELFAIHPDYDERFGFDMLEVAFEMFPDRDYCIACLPSNHSSFPLLEHFTLVTPHTIRMRFINETLYVAHVNSVRGEVRVRLGEECDMDNLSNILEHVPRREALMELFETTLNSNALDSYMLLSQDQAIGMVILGPLEDGNSIRTQYELEPEPRLPGSDGAILAGIVSPVMEPHGRWYIRDILRQSRYTSLFWICQPVAKGEASPNRNMMSMAEWMKPVRPRLSIPNISRDKSLDRLLKDVATPFALWMIERPLAYLPKVYVNNNIVVVGASRTALAFLETLIMGPTAKYLTFTNITLVSEYGLPTVADYIRAADTCVPRDGRYSDRYLKSIPFAFYLDVMHAVMNKIDRKKKCIHLKGGGVKFYDELVICCGQQFQHPDYLKESLARAKETRKGKPCERILMDNPKYKPDRLPLQPELPENVMLINSVFEASVCLKTLLNHINEDREALRADNPIVVYGDCIEAYCCIAALLEIGISARNIMFVEPFPSEDTTAMRVNCFNDETVDERVQKRMEVLGIRALRRCKLSNWRMVGSRVVSLRFMDPLHCIHLSCFALFYYGLKAINLHAFKAINECGLVYDGGLVVGPMFNTNDLSIYAAGTCAQYSRRLYSSRWTHRYYYSEDVGEALAELFLRKLDPFVMAHQEFSACPSSIMPPYSSSLYMGAHPSIAQQSKPFFDTTNRRWEPVTKFNSPIVQSATFPGPLYYMKLRKPGIEVPMEVKAALPRQGHTLTTDKRGNYFRLQLNVLHCVESVTCLSTQSFPNEIYAQLYGKHEAFFNKLLVRYRMELIDDFYEFFTQPWMAALYQETFVDLLNNINQQDVGTVFDLLSTTFPMIGDGTPAAAAVSKAIKSDAQAWRRRSSSMASVHPDCGYGPTDAHKLGTFRSVIDKYIGRSNTLFVMPSQYAEVPTECGQSEALREEAEGFWKTVGGERIVIAHIARYLNRNSVLNPHYAPPHPSQLIPQPDTSN